MRILHCLYDHPDNPWLGGGGAIRGRLFNEALVRQGHAVEWICGAFPDCRDGEQAGVHYRHLGQGRGYFSGTFSYARAARRFLQAEAGRFDLVIEDFAPWNPLHAWRLASPPTVVQVQNHLGAQILRRYGPLGLPFWWAERTEPRRFRHAIVVNDSLNQTLGLRGHVVSNGIDPSLLEAEPVEGDYLAFMGRLDFHQKGIDVLLEAVKGTDLPLKIAGDGPHRDRLQRELAGHPRIEWTGHLTGDAKTEFLRRARMVVLPSRYEGQNIVVLEAAALGKAVVVTDLPSLAYATRAGFARSVPAGSVAGLRKEIESLWGEADLRHGLEAHARPFAREHTWPRLAALFERHCLDIVQAAGS